MGKIKENINIKVGAKEWEKYLRIIETFQIMKELSSQQTDNNSIFFLK